MTRSLVLRWKNAAFVLAIACAPNGCSCSSTTNPPGASELDASPDGSSADATADANASDGAAKPDAPTCELHLPAGITNVAAVPANDPEPGGYGEEVSMALDENDDPMFAFFTRATGGAATVHFTRWDKCAGAFTPLVTVDSLPNGVGDNPGEREVSIAYDRTTHEIGIVYNVASNPSSVGDGNPYVNLATMKAGATSFTIQTVSVGLNSVSGTSYPAIAMSSGQLYVAYVQGNYNCDCCGGLGSCTGVQFLTSTTTPPVSDAGDEEAPEAGPPPPHYFTAQTVQLQGQNAQTRGGTVPLAVDAMGRVGLAFAGAPVNYDTTIYYWRNDTAGAVAVTDSNGVQNDYVDLSLAYDGNKPRIAGHLTAVSPANYALFFSASDDGVTWNPIVQLPEANMAAPGTTIALALDGTGNGVVLTPQTRQTRTARTRSWR